MTAPRPRASRLAPFAAALALCAPLASCAPPAPGPPPTSGVSPSAVSAPAPSTPAASAAAAPLPSEAAVRDAVLPALADAPGTASVQVSDLADGTSLLAKDAGAPVAPASGLKLLTAAAVLQTLGADATLPTRVVAVPAEDGATELVLVGGGDVLLGTGASDPEAVAGRAGLRTLAERTVAELRERGVSGRLVVSQDLRLFQDETPLNPAWPAGTDADGDISALGPLATYGARARPGVGTDRVPDPAGFAALAFQKALDETTAEGSGLEVGLRDEIPATATPRERVTGAEPLAEVRSAPVREQVAHLLAHSDNQVSEALAHAAARAAGLPATHDGAARLLTATAARLGVDVGEIRLLDASGLAPGDRFGAAPLVQVLRATAHDPGLRGVVEGLPHPGQDSTLADRLPSGRAHEAVAAKTGTLADTVSLTGTVTTRAGRRLAFSVICSDIGGDVAGARAAVDAAVSALAEL